jgi:LmbE family N-acetylglucosaminyl deacetylase
VTDLSGRTVLAVFAHPDDESLACGGTLACLADQGARVVLLCASRGERGSHTGPAWDGTLGMARVLEVREAAEALGISDVILLDHPDGDLRWARVTEFAADIAAALTRFRPAAVVTFGEDGLYWHLDHVGVHERTTTAVRSLGAAAPPLYYVSMPKGVMRGIVDMAASAGWAAPLKGFWSLAPDAFGLAAESPTIVVNVGPWVPRKLAAIRGHRTQIGVGSPFAMLTDADAVRWLGIEHFHRAPDIAPDVMVLERLACT